MLGGVHVGDRAAADDVGHTVLQQFAADDEHARGAGAADELVRAEHHGILVRQRVLGAPRVHVDVDVRGGGGEIPHGERSVAVEQVGNGTRVRQDAGDVGGGRERADLHRSIGEAHQFGFQLGKVDVTVGVFLDGDHIGDRLAPGQLVGVVLERADEHDRAFARRDVLQQVVAVVEVGGQPDVHDADQPIDGSGGARTAEDDARVVVAAHGVVDDAASVFAQASGLQAGARRLGVGVGVAGQHLVADEVFDEAERPAGCGVVRVGDAVRTVGPVHHLIVADHRLADLAQQRGFGGAGHAGQAIPHPPAPIGGRTVVPRVRPRPARVGTVLPVSVTDHRRAGRGRGSHGDQP